MPEIISAEYVDGYKVRVHFNNGESGVVDLEEALWGPVFEPLRDVNVFKKFEVSDVFHTITWENGADLAPEYLYDKMAEQTAAHGHAEASR
jgi:hypothetical protein